MSALEIQRLQDRIAELEEILGVHPSATAALRGLFGLSPDGARALGMLMSRQIIPFGTMYTMIYGHRAECDQPVEKSLHVLLHKLRKKLKAAGIELSTVVSEGYLLRPEAKRAIRNMLASLADEGADRAPVVVRFEPLPTSAVRQVA